VKAAPGLGEPVLDDPDICRSAPVVVPPAA
jgi:hypothetical protein